MARMLRTLAAVALLAGLVPGPALAQEAEPLPEGCRLIRGAETPEDLTDDVSVCRQDVWFHQASTKAGNLAAFGQDDFPSWDGDEPTGSYTTGSGGGYLGTSAFHQTAEAWDPRGTATFEGTFTGHLDTLAVTMYLFPPAKMVEEQQTGGPVPFPTDFRLLLDGEWLWETSGDVNMVTDGQAVKRIDFALTNIYEGIESNGVTPTDGEHTLRLSVHGTGLATAGAVFVYDAAEVPSGMVFNIEPENLDDYTVFSM